MTEPEIIQQQRKLLRTFSGIDTQYTQAEAEIEAQWQELEQALSQTKEFLKREGIEEGWDQTNAVQISATPNADPYYEFTQAVKRTLQAVAEVHNLQDLPYTWKAIRTWEAHKSRMFGLAYHIFLAFSPLGNLLGSGGLDKEVKLWDAVNGRLIHTLKGHKSGVACVAFAPDGRLLASGSWGDHTVKLWDVASGREARTFGGHARDVNCVAFSPDGRLLASGSDDKTVKLWDVASGREVRIFEGHEYWVKSVVFSPDGRLLASGGSDKTVKLWDVASGREMRTFEGHELVVRSVAFSPDGRYLASGSDDKTVKLWKVASGREMRTFGRHKNKVVSVAFSPDGRLLASGSVDKTVKLWDVANGKELHTFGKHKGEVRSVAFSPDGHLLAVSHGVMITLYQGSWPELQQRTMVLAQSVAETNFWHSKVRERLAAEHRVALQTQSVAQMQAWEERLAHSLQPERTPWVDRSWNDWSPSTNASIGTLRFGQFRGRNVEDLAISALISFPGEYSLLLKTRQEGRKAAVQGIQSLLLRLLAAVPPGKLRFTFIDPVGLGQNVTPFMHLADYDKQLVTSRAWTEPRHIEQRLAELTEHIETVIQTYLRNEYTTIEAYNEQAGEIAEPYRILVVFDFPTNFSEDAARRLLSISQNGPRCGVYTVVLADTEKPLPHGFALADLERVSTVIAWNGNHFVWEDDDFRNAVLELDAPPPSELFNKIVKAVGEASLEAGNVEVPFARIAPPPEHWCQVSSAEGVRVPLGPIGARRVQHLDLGQGTAQHALIAGRTGSDKSTLFHTLITNLALTYSPDEVMLYLVDFKKGVEFKGYATHKLPHARVVAIESEREFGLSVLQGLDAELKRRGDLFRAAGVDSLADYRKKRGKKMPRILLIVDEFQEFFTEDDRVAAEASQVLDRLVRQGRAFGVHVILGSQTLAGAYALSRSTMDQMAVRIALQCTEADSRLILADDNPAARLLSRPGEAIYNDANGLVEGNHPFQVAWLDDDEREAYLEKIRDFAETKGYRSPQPQIVFEGNAPALVAQNQPLNDLLAASDWPEPARRISAWLGEPVAIKPPIAAHFRRQSASNLLIVGRDDEAAMGMMSAGLISIAAQHAPDTARFFILDFSSVDAPYADLLARLAEDLPYSVQRGRRRQLPGIMSAIAAEVERRLEEDESSVRDEPAMYLFIYGLQRARDLRPEDDLGYSFGIGEEEKPPSPAKQFANILREGPDLGIHTLIWCDTYTNLARTLDRRSLREFEMRVAMQMSAEDSVNLIDFPAAGNLGLYRAYFYSEDEARLEKFRPYGLPSITWIQRVYKLLKK